MQEVVAERGCVFTGSDGKLPALFDNSILEDERQQDELPVGATLLLGQYRIERYLVRGGFGITYLAHDSLDRQYVIKECFPGALCGRSGGKVYPLSSEWANQFASVLKHFLSEARRVARLSHPNIVQVHQVFEENNTAYMAMAYVDGEDMLSISDNEPERLTPDVLGSTLRDALNAIDYLHGIGILHRDISPDNLMLGADNHLTLIDFGAAREQLGRDNRALSVLLAVKDGYSPHEFYLKDVEQTPASDLYSLGATFYHFVTGAAPPNSQDRVAALAAGRPDPYVRLIDGDWDHDVNFLLAIDRALEVLPQDRIGTAREWLDLLDAPPCARPERPTPALDGDLSVTISRLVETTNREVQQGMPGYAKKLADQRLKNRRQRATDYGQQEKPAQQVDIFGNPVENVEAWMREQDRAVRGQAKAVRRDDNGRSEPANKKDTAGAERPVSRSTIGRFLAACLPGRRESDASALQN